MNKIKLKMVADANRRLVRYQKGFSKEQLKAFHMNTATYQNDLKALWSCEAIGSDGKPNLEPFNEQPYLFLIGAMVKVAKRIRKKI